MATKKTLTVRQTGSSTRRPENSARHIGGLGLGPYWQAKNIRRYTIDPRRYRQSGSYGGSSRGIAERHSSRRRSCV